MRSTGWFHGAQWCKSLGRTAREPKAMLRIQYLLQWFGLSGPAMEEALHDGPAVPGVRWSG